MKNYDKKIEKIKEREKQLLEIAQCNIYFDGRSFRKYAKEVIEALDYHNKTGKKYIAVVNAQKAIKKYTKQILEAKDVEEIKEIRKKINKSINKIKEEMKKRDIDEEMYNKYCEKAKQFRKRIAQNIRYLKRKEKIKEIKKLNKHIDKLSKDDLKKLRRLVKNELEYSKRNLIKEDEVLYGDIDYIPNVDLESMDSEDSDITYYELQEEDFTEEEKREIEEAKVEKVKEKKDKKEKEKKKKKNKKKKHNKEKKDFLLEDNIGTTSDFDEEKQEPISFPTGYRLLEDYLEDKIETYDERYNIEKIDEYTGGVVKNLHIFGKNVSKMLKNKEKSRIMLTDYNSYCRRPELLGYSDYIRRHNSIIHNIKEAITTNVFKEKEYLYDDEMYSAVRWIMNYCENNNMEISYPRRLSA